VLTDRHFGTGFFNALPVVTQFCISIFSGSSVIPRFTS